MSRSRPAGAAMAAALAVWVAAAAGQEPTFKARVDEVRIDVLVTERGRAVTGLTAADFEVKDNGALQPVHLVSLGDVPVAAVLALDLSRSVAGPRLEALKRAGLSFVDALTPADSAALVGFNRLAVQHVGLTHDLDLVRRGLARAAALGDTALVDATLAAMLLGDADAGRTLVVVFSDGVDTASFTSPELALATARRVNGVVYAVSASREAPTFLQDVADATGGRVIDLAADGDPAPAFVEILREFRQRYVISFTPSEGAAGGWHTLDVRVKQSGMRALSRRGYFAGRP
ncbi:MAG: VWA domain-containing protein [Vicinamibacterales bacterium]